LELAKARYSCRKFDPTMISDEVRGQILEAGRVSPTAVNYQPQGVLVILDVESIQSESRAPALHMGRPFCVHCHWNGGCVL